MKDLNHFIDLKEKSFWGKNDTSIWIASSFSFQRNLSIQPFPKKMDPHESEILLNSLKQSFLRASCLETPVFFEMNELKTWEREYLLEHFLTICAMNSSECKSGFVIDKTGTFLGMINKEDHLVLQSIDSQKNWTKTWKKLCNVETELAQNHIFAYSHKFGYLTSNFTNSGTALTVQTFLHLPCLIHLNQIHEATLKELDEDVLVTDLSGQENFIGDIIIIQNRFTIGLTEEHILESVHKSATKLMGLEKTLRTILRKNPDTFILDKVRRSLGLLRYSYQIKTKEALSALSFIKLGINLKWISGITEKEINAIFFGVRRAHLSRYINAEIPNDQLPHKRAEFLQHILRTIIMKI